MFRGDDDSVVMMRVGDVDIGYKTDISCLLYTTTSHPSVLSLTLSVQVR